MKFKRVHADTHFDIFVNGFIKSVTGVYYLCDGGYHKRTCMMNPLKHISTRSDRLWSEWVESTRKDVECTFGILKSRWRFLRNGIVLHDQNSIDNAFFTSCILHNLILEYDGLDSRWETDKDWETLHPQPNNSDEGFDENDEPVQSAQQTLINARVRLWMSSRENSPEEELVLGNNFEEEIDVDFNTKRRSLIDHFIYSYNLGLVKWPNCLPPEQKNIYNKGK